MLVVALRLAHQSILRLLSILTGDFAPQLMLTLSAAGQMHDADYDLSVCFPVVG